MLNILILNWRDPKNPKSGGAEAVTFAHASAWVKAGNSVDWFTSAFSGGKESEVIEGVRIIRRGGSITTLLYAPIYYFMSKNKYDIVIDEIHGLPYFTPLYIKKKKIAFIHEVAGKIWDYMYPFPVNVIGKYIESCYFSLYKGIPFWTDAPSTVAELSEKGIRKKMCTVIPCPINKPKELRRYKKEKIPTVIFVSRLVKMKGIEDVISAVSYMNQKLKVQLWIVGAGEQLYVSKLKKLVEGKDIKNVKFFGKVPEVRKFELLARSHLLLHASVKEGWGLVVLEAASQLTPTVAYNVSGLRDTVKDGKTGCLVKNNTPEELAKEALSLLKNKRQYASYQKKGLGWVNSLTWKRATEESLNLINRALKLS